METILIKASLYLFFVFFIALIIWSTSGWRLEKHDGQEIMYKDPITGTPIDSLTVYKYRQRFYILNIKTKFTKDD